MDSGILSRSGEAFKDREEAGRLLARELEQLKGEKAVVLAIPRGGIIVGREMSRALGAELDIVITRKLGAPGNPEMAIGAVAEDGRLFLHEGMVSGLGVSEEYIEEEKKRQMGEIGRRKKAFRAARPKVPLKGKKVIIADDGLATGATMRAAVWAARQEEPERLIVAVPVAPEDAVSELSEDAEVLCLRAPPYFNAVGQFYRDFEQVEDSEVSRILKEEHEGR